MALTDDFDLGALALGPGEGRRLSLDVRLAPFALGGQTYRGRDASQPVVLDVARLSGSGYSLRLRLSARMTGPCVRCLEEAAPELGVDAREVDQPGGGEELDSPYVHDDVLDLAGWTRDAVSLALPTQVVCRPECAGLCAVCGANLNQAGPEHRHERAPDRRWAKLSELRFD
ncbi:MAG: DUF177 domain-containing protein [Actinobacteria bacterium]|nr:MAG: DUF177 domain-containing protein [Actinomycetota bacterium]